MKKILHLVCNSHIDPVWQWDWDEGAAAALATFYAACNLLDKYDFVFCHNEVLVYQYIEKHDPELFKRIQALVKEGKWKIMGGWYCQPDCLVPSGESFIRQCALGREYFAEKFNSRPTTALNFDSFGHSRGLPQILKKCGFDSYIFCRPLDFYAAPGMNENVIPHGPFIWESYDGSRITALRYEDKYNNYTSPFGKAKEAINLKLTQYEQDEIVPVLWGVGNHGGLSSEKDLEDIMVLKDEKKGEWKIIHSSLENYFASVEAKTVFKNQIYVFPKSYSSISAIKNAHDQLENVLYEAEKICTTADLLGKRVCNKEVFYKAEQALCQIEFHDVLSGTAVKSGTDASIRRAHHAIDELKEEMTASFFALSKDLPKVKPNFDNFVVLNPYPYRYKGYVEAEIYPASCPEYGKTIYDLTIYDINNNVVPYQMIKEESNIMDQHRVRLILKVDMAPTSITQFSVKVDFKEYERYRVLDQTDDIYLKDSVKEIRISRKTGLLESFKVNGVETLAKPAGKPYIFEDNEDPWGWRINSLGDNVFNENGWPIGKGTKMKAMKLDSSGKGPFEGLLGVNLIEQGDYLNEVQCLFKQYSSYVVMTYKIYKDTEYIDIDTHVIWNESSRGLKLQLPVNGSKKYFAQAAFGIEEYKNNNMEYPSNRYIGNKIGEYSIVLYNKSGIHSVSKQSKNIYVTLLNGAAYCAHPTHAETPLLDKHRFNIYPEQGTHDFSFRLGVNKVEECEKIAAEFNEPIYQLLSFPHGDGKNIAHDVVSLSNSNIVITSLKRRNNEGYIIRLYNGSFKSSSTDLKVLNATKTIHFSKFEFKTFIFDGKTLVESEDSSIY